MGKENLSSRKRYCFYAPCKKKMHTQMEKYRCCIGCPDKVNCEKPCMMKEGCEHIVTRDTILWRILLC